jgi:phosphate transport system protein
MEHHIDHHFDEALDSLKQQIVLMGSKVEVMVAEGIKALEKRDEELARHVIESDHTINALEVSIDEQCIELLARYQPAASDLRFLTRGLKIVTDLERVGDLAVNIASRVLDITRHGETPVDLKELSEIVQRMLKASIDAFVNFDESKALGVLRDDDIVDEKTQQFVTELIERSEKDPKHIQRYFPATSIVRYLERIADHSTNIAELAVFMAKGRDIRHGRPI